MSENKNLEPIDGGTSGDLAVVGEGTPNESRVSLQVLQNIYHELTGKSEDVSKNYDDPFQTSLSDLEQLDYRIAQCCEQYNIRAANCSVKVFYVNDTQETFSSFERFSGFNAGTTSAVESVLIRYNFLIILPKVDKPQSYTLSVRMASRIAIEKQMRGNMPFRMPKILRTMGNRTAVVSVKYVDYSVARSLLNTVDHWLDGLPKASTPKVWKLVTARSHYLPLFSRYFVGAVVAFLIYGSADTFLPESSSLKDLGVYILWSFVGLFFAYKLADHIGNAAEDSLDNWSALSYLSLTAGDKNLINSAQNTNRVSTLLAVCKFGGALLVSLAAKIIVGYLAVK